MGSNKTGDAYPSTMIVSICSEKVHVEFYPTHIGHRCHIGRMRLNDEERNKIAGKVISIIRVRCGYCNFVICTPSKILNDIIQDVHNTYILYIHTGIHFSGPNKIFDMTGLRYLIYFYSIIMSTIAKILNI